MSDDELAMILKGEVVNARGRHETNMTLVLFGIKYAEELEGRVSAVVRNANLPRKDGTPRMEGSGVPEVNLGRQLAKYVRLLS